MQEILVKTIKKEFPDKITTGIAWFTFIGLINNIKLAKRELQLLSFINYRGTISSSSAKEEFCKMFDSSPATISNMVGKLYKMKPQFLIKEKFKVKVHPSLRVDFSNDLVIRLFMTTKKEEVANAD